MLEKIIIKNFKSFKNETTIDFRRTNYKLLGNSNVSDSGVLKSTLFVGANASGKSNVLDSIKVLLDLLFKEKDIKSDLFICLFSGNQEFSLDYYFDIDGSKIRYFIKSNPLDDLLFENLYQDGNLLLERMGMVARSYMVKDEEIVYRDRDMNKETLFLRTMFFNTRFSGNETLKKWFEFLQNSIFINAYNREVYTYGKGDLRLIPYMDGNGLESLNKFFKHYKFDQVIGYAKPSNEGKKVIRLDKEDDKSKILKLFFKKKGISQPIPYVMESLGNQTLVNLLPSFLSFTQNNGMLLVDEFSSGFHNELEELLVKYFMKNSSLSQMIFVSHSTNLLSTSLLRPDQIYSVNFNGKEGSQIKRFSEEQPREAQNIEKMYLSGIFDGLPGYEYDNK